MVQSFLILLQTQYPSEAQRAPHDPALPTSLAAPATARHLALATQASEPQPALLFPAQGLRNSVGFKSLPAAHCRPAPSHAHDQPGESSLLTQSLSQLTGFIFFLAIITI